MPHFGLMDENEMGAGDGALQRARLHVRAGRRQLRQGKRAAGITTLYDALLSAMRYHLFSDDLRKNLKINGDEDLENDHNLFQLFIRSEIIQTTMDADTFDRLADQALSLDEPRFDCSEMLRKIERLMTQLDVLPFDEKILPPEDPAVSS